MYEQVKHKLSCIIFKFCFIKGINKQIDGMLYLNVGGHYWRRQILQADKLRY